MNWGWWHIEILPACPIPRPDTGWSTIGHRGEKLPVSKNLDQSSVFQIKVWNIYNQINYYLPSLCIKIKNIFVAIFDNIYLKKKLNSDDVDVETSQVMKKKYFSWWMNRFLESWFIFILFKYLRTFHGNFVLRKHSLPTLKVGRICTCVRMKETAQRKYTVDGSDLGFCLFVLRDCPWVTSIEVDSNIQRRRRKPRKDKFPAFQLSAAELEHKPLYPQNSHRLVESNSILGSCWSTN